MSLFYVSCIISSFYHNSFCSINSRCLFSRHDRWRHLIQLVCVCVCVCSVCVCSLSVCVCVFCVCMLSLSLCVCVLCVCFYQSGGLQCPQLFPWWRLRRAQRVSRNALCFGEERKMATSNNPRKFSEKIALHNQKQAEETAAFEEVMKDLSITRAARVRVSETAAKRARSPAAM